jgi:predicted nucleic acid-binding protein
VICVIDASLALSWLFEDEQTPPKMALLRDISIKGCLVPSLWRLEIANALQVTIQRKRIHAEYRDKVLRLLNRLPIEVDEETDGRAWTDTLQLADTHRLTVYDACYLELTLRATLPLATCDSELAAAATSAGVKLLETK